MAHAEATAAFAYDSADLAFFDGVLDRLMGELVAKSEARPTAECLEALRRQLGVKLFASARAGERDYADLRQRILAGMFSGTRDHRP
jgi:hypothetical protein